MFQDRLQALWGALAAGWEKEGELVTSSLEFEFRLQFPCGFPVDCHISANQCECKQSLKNMWKIIANVISAIQHFASTFSTLACSRLSDSRAGSELGCTPGKQVGGGGEFSPRFFFFLREFFSCSLLSERLEQAISMQTFKFQRRSCKLSFLFLPRHQSAPYSLLAG